MSEVDRTISVTVDGRYNLTVEELKEYGLPDDFTDRQAAEAVREWWFETHAAARLIVEVHHHYTFQSEALLDPPPEHVVAGLAVIDL